MPVRMKTGALLPLAHVEHSRHSVLNEHAIHQLVFITSHMKQASVWVQFVVHCLRSSYILLMYSLCECFSQEAVISAFSPVTSLHRKLNMNLTLCVMYCGLMRQHSQAVVWTVSSIYMNRNWRILLLFDAIHFNSDVASNVTAKL
jgi:hypothetical protein